MLLAISCPAQDQRDVGVFRRDGLPKSGTRLAVVVGIDAYQSLAPLRFAERDADDVARELGAIGFEVMRMLPSGRDGAVRPLNGDVILEQVRKMCRLAQPDGVVLFYFSGHGFEDAAGRTFVCPFAAELDDLPGTALELVRVQRELEQSGVHKRLLIADMCRNQPAKSTDQRALTLRQFENAKGTGLLFSTAPGFRSWEPRDGMRDEAGLAIENGLFTHYLLRGLRGEADRGLHARWDGLLTFRELAYFVADGLTSLSMRSDGIDQRPYLRWDGTAEDVLLRVLPEPAGDAVLPPVGQLAVAADADARAVLARLPATYDLYFGFDAARLAPLRGLRGTMANDRALGPLVRFATASQRARFQHVFMAIRLQSLESLDTVVVATGVFERAEVLPFLQSEWRHVDAREDGVIEVADWRKAPSDEDRQLRALGMRDGPWCEPPLTEAVLARDDLLVLGSRAGVAGYAAANAASGVLADSDLVAMLRDVDPSGDVWFLLVMPEIVRQAARNEREPAFASLQSAVGWLRLGGGERNVRGVLTGAFADAAGATAMREQLSKALASLQQRLQSGTVNLPDDADTAAAGSILLATLRSAEVEASQATVRLRVRDRRGR